MKIINSMESTARLDTGYKGIFDGGDGDKTITISEPRITTSDAAHARAYAEMLSGGYETTKIELETAYDAKLHPNDVVSVAAPQKGIPRKLSADRFIVKEIEIKGDSKVITMSIKGERYD